MMLGGVADEGSSKLVRQLINKASDKHNKERVVKRTLNLKNLPARDPEFLGNLLRRETSLFPNLFCNITLIDGEPKHQQQKNV